MIRPKVPGFKLETKIGNGTFAEVYKAKRYNGDEQFVAIKCIKKGELSASTVNSIITEIKALKLLRHPHIIQMLDFVWDDNFIYIIMEYCEGGDLSVFIKTYHHLKENICKLFLSQLASAIKYLRQHNIVHMDLKPQNLLLTSRKHPLLKLSDFGLAQFLQNREKETSLRGSPLYMAPEILLQQSYDASVDLWSTGIILYECIFGKPPYTSKSLRDLVGKIKSDVPVTIPTNIAISAECRDLLTKLLVKDSNGRLSFDDFFKHPFVHQPNQLHQQSSVLEHLRNSAVENGSTARPIDSSSSRPSNEITKRYPPFQELHSLASATPSMASALEIGIEGVQYDAEGQLTLALERYTAALEIMIPLLRKELKGRRKELLHQQVTLWMKRAEEIRVQLDQQDSVCQELLSLDEDAGYCTMQ